MEYVKLGNNTKWSAIDDLKEIGERIEGNDCVYTYTSSDYVHIGDPTAAVRFSHKDIRDATVLLIGRNTVNHPEPQKDDVYHVTHAVYGKTLSGLYFEISKTKCYTHTCDCSFECNCDGELECECVWDEELCKCPPDLEFRNVMISIHFGETVDSFFGTSPKAKELNDKYHIF